jgi:multidrug resistance efflux pump
MLNTPQPDEIFVERLGWQLASEFRRMDRTKAAGKVAVPRRLFATAVAVGALLTGVAATKAADVLKDSWRKKIELARAETQVRVKAARLESIRQMAVRTEDLASRGLVREDESWAMAVAAEKARLDLEKARLDLDEVKASGDPPNNELHAPLKDGRDFVSERLRLEAETVKADMEALAKRWNRLNGLFENGLVQPDDRDGLRADIDSRKGVISGILKRIELRGRYIAGDITARDLDVEDRLSAAESNLKQVRTKVEALTSQRDRLAALAAKGMVSSREVGPLRFALEAAQAEMKLALLEVEVLRTLR